MAGRVFLKRGRDAPVRGGSPWVFSGAIERIEPVAIEPGATIEVADHSGATIGLGYFHPATTIAVRMLWWGERPPRLEDIIARRLKSALELRRRVIAADTDCYRLGNGDGDGLSGVVGDRYGRILVMQLLTAHAD